MRVSTKEQGQKFLPFKGITGNILISGEKTMLICYEMEPKSEIPTHSHVHEQAGICLKGKIEFQGEDKKVVIKPNDVYIFHSNEKHGAKVVGKEKAVVLEAFSPPREDYLALFSKNMQQ